MVARSARDVNDTIDRRRAFTLIELLVVIAIIAILASMLLPALGQARERGVSSVCLGNIRQAFIALSMYADDYEGSYMPAYKLVSGGQPQFDYTREMVKDGYLTLRGDKANPDGSGSGLATAAVLICPKGERLAIASDTTSAYRVRRYGAYTYNGYLCNSADGSNTATDGFMPLHLRWIRGPEKTILLIDGTNGSNWAGSGTARFYHQTYHPTGMASILYFDGHATGNQRRNEIPTSNSHPTWNGKW